MLVLPGAKKPSGETRREGDTAVPGLDNANGTAALEDELPVGVVLLLLLLPLTTAERVPPATRLVLPTELLAVLLLPPLPALAVTGEVVGKVDGKVDAAFEVAGRLFLIPTDIPPGDGELPLTSVPGPGLELAGEAGTIPLLRLFLEDSNSDEEVGVDGVVDRESMTDEEVLVLADVEAGF